MRKEEYERIRGRILYFIERLIILSKYHPEIEYELQGIIKGLQKTFNPKQSLRPLAPSSGFRKRKPYVPKWVQKKYPRKREDEQHLIAVAGQTNRAKILRHLNVNTDYEKNMATKLNIHQGTLHKNLVILSKYSLTKFVKRRNRRNYYTASKKGKEILGVIGAE
jgi:hypothetical protein